MAFRRVPPTAVTNGWVAGFWGDSPFRGGGTSIGMKSRKTLGSSLASRAYTVIWPVEASEPIEVSEQLEVLSPQSVFGTMFAGMASVESGITTTPIGLIPAGEP